MSAKNEPDELLTTNQAAAYMSATGEPLKLSGMRSLARFARIRGFELLAPEDQWPDRRTRMYSKNALDEYKRARETRDWKIPTDEQDVPWLKRTGERTATPTEEPAGKKARGKSAKSA